MSKLLFAFALIPTLLFGQTNRYFVSFKDKTNNPYSVSNPIQFLSQKSIDRRAKENFATIDEDLPVNQTYVQQVKATGAEVYFTSRWMNGLLIQADVSLLSAISALTFVSKIELVAPGSKLTEGRTQTTTKMEQVNQASALQNDAQLKMLSIDKMHNDGFHGEGIDVAVFDGGFKGVNSLPAFQPIYQESRLKSVFNFVTNTTDVYTADEHGTEVLSILAGTTSNYTGGAYKANFFLYQTEDVSTEYRIEEYNWLFAAERADSAGVDVINSSLGYSSFDDASMDYSIADLDGQTSVVSRAARKAVERGIVVVNSAGNLSGNPWKYIDVPADAQGVIAVGSVNSLGDWSSFSLVGPTADGRVKPDVAAMGSSTVLINSTGSIVTGNGTSFSSPLVASLVAGLRQVFPAASASEIYWRITKSASQVTHSDNYLGYGIPNYEGAREILNFTSTLRIYPNPVTDGVIRMVFKDPQAENITVILFSSTGQKVAEFSDTVTAQNNPYFVDISVLSPGLYHLNVIAGRETVKMSIVK